MVMEWRRRILVTLVGFALGIVVGVLLYMLIHEKAESAKNDNRSLQILLAGCEAAEALYDKDFDALAAQLGADGLRFIAFAPASDTSDQIFTKSQVKGFAGDQKLYIFGIDSASGQVIEKRAPEFIDAYLNTADFAASPQVGINRVLKSSNTSENLLEFYPLTEYALVDFYYPPSETNGMDWMSLKVVLKTTEQGYELVAFVRGVYTVQ